MLVAVPPNLKMFIDLCNENTEFIAQLLISDRLVCRGFIYCYKTDCTEWGKASC